MLTDEYRYKILKQIEERPEISQRELAESVGISLGKANYCIKALIKVGLLKVSNFKNSKRKLAYMYLLTPIGAEEKAKVTIRFLKGRIQEFEALRREIDLLQQEISEQGNLDVNSPSN